MIGLLVSDLSLFWRSRKNSSNNFKRYPQDSRDNVENYPQNSGNNHSVFFFSMDGESQSGRSLIESSNASASSVNDNRVDQNQILRPYNALRNLYEPRRVLVVASETSLNVPQDLKTFTEGENGVSVHFTKQLPLANNRHPPIDVIVLVYKVFDKNSFKTVKDSLPYIDIQYMVGKCFILVTSDSEFCCSDILEIENFAGSHNLPIHFVIKKRDANGVKQLKIPSNLMSLYCPRSGRDANSLLANATLNRSARWCLPPAT